MLAISLFRLFLKSLIAFSLALVLLAVLIVDKTPKTSLLWVPNMHLARELFQKTADAAQQNKDLIFSETELNHATNSILNRFIKSGSKIQLLNDNTAQFELTLKPSRLLSNAFINIRFILSNDTNSLDISHLSIGSLAINQTLADLLVNFILEHSVLKHYHRLAMEHIQSVQILNHQLVIHYQINTLKAHIEASIKSISPATLSFYQQRIEAVVKNHDQGQRLSLAELLQPLFQEAYRRSTPNSAIIENIAIIYAVAAYVNSNEIPFYLPIKPLEFSQNIYQPVYLYKRTDQAKHFMLSAALTSTGGAQMADLLGQEKELRDAQSKSGFSFIDIAADRAGMKFTEQAIRSPQLAHDFQKTMSEIKDYTSFMPQVQDMPEKLTHQEFTQQFDSINSKAYKRLLQEIDNRIEALPIYPKS